MRSTKKTPAKKPKRNAATNAKTAKTEGARASDQAIGPRPLHLHIFNTMNMLSAAAWPYAIQPHVREKAAVTVSSMAKEMMQGIEAYQASPMRMQRPQYDKIWQADGVSLLCPFKKTTDRPIFIVPSLINRFHILDLEVEHSFIHFLKDQGFCPYILDWGIPDGVERRFDINAYITERLIPALQFLNKETKTKPHVLGYCMGGTLAVAAASMAAQNENIMASLTTLAAPWDFHADDQTMALRMHAFCAAAQGVMNDQGVLPVDWIQALFASIDPLFAFNKFRAFSKMNSDDEEAKRFVVVEDWLNDGVDLAAPAARQTLLQWYGDNEPASGVWTIEKHLVDASQIKIPTMIVAAGVDRLVPPKSALALAQQIEHAHTITPNIGHIGMMASNRAVIEVWEPVSLWLKQQK